MDGYELYIFRHAVAEERGDAWPDDSKRPLTVRGTERMRKNVRGLLRLGISLDVVLTSPLVRTRQTSEVIAGAFEPRPPIVAVDALAPGGSAASVRAELEKQSRRSHIAIVGHEPGIGELAANLAGLGEGLEFKKGGVCRIDMDSLTPQAAGRLMWFLTPRLMRALRR
jgi:phosphohistidine phosphatase